MATFTNTSANNVKVMYKLVGKRYEARSAEQYTGMNTATESDFPWDEVLVGPGVTVNIGETTWQKVVDMGAPVAPALVRVGPQRGVATDIVNRVVDHNGNRNNIKVLFKVKGRQYNVAIGDGDVIDEPGRTSYPWEEAIVGPDRAFYVAEDIEWTKVINMPVNAKLDAQLEQMWQESMYRN
jgi:hypothetical protein